MRWAKHPFYLLPKRTTSMPPFSAPFSGSRFLALTLFSAQPFCPPPRKSSVHWGREIESEAQCAKESDSQVPDLHELH